ncbi:MAG TPA: ATP-binding protein [Thermoanaerobaculia bacterium]|nr:ATP-binding protein [Thermoanaerobaculia bacterium]
MTASQPKPGQAVLILERAGDGARLLARVAAMAEEGGFEAHLFDEERALELPAEHWIPESAQVAAVLIGPGVERPLLLARRASRALSAGGLIVFLGDEERSARLRREMSLAPMIGRFRFLAEGDEVLARVLTEAARSSSQRRQTRTTLDRINLSLAKRPLDGGEMRKLVISDRYLASLLQQAQQAILPLDDEGRILTLNRAAATLFGVSEAEVAARPLEALFDPESQTAVAPLLAEVRDGSAEVRREISLVRDAGAPMVVELSIAPVQDDSGHRIGFLAIARDITERQRAEAERTALLARERKAREEAETASRAKDEFVATMSHELRTPLNAMLGWTRLLRMGALDGAGTARALEAVERNALAQARLVEDLLDVSRIITGKLRLNVQSIELQPIIEAAIDSVRPAVDAKNIRLQLILDSGIGFVLGDPQRLQQIFWNLVSNAVKFTPKGGRIRVTLERINSHLEITVSDTGQGITPEFLPFVFDRFRQADGTTTRSHGGLGLGLAIVRHLVELHGGQVSVDSRGEGQGAVFTVRLPLLGTRGHIVSAPERVHSASQEPVAFELCEALSGLRLLVVDDDPDTLEILQVLLSGCGAEVRPARSVREALSELSRWSPDLLLSDVGMPGEDGYALITQARELDASRGRWTPAIALTAFARPEDRVRLLSAGFQAHLPKPVDPSDLVATIVSQVRLIR